MSITPTITAIEVIPVAGRDGMLMNLSGAHAPYFTRNVVLVHDSAGRTGVGEVPGGEGIRQALEDSNRAATDMTRRTVRVLERMDTLGMPPARIEA